MKTLRHWTDSGVSSLGSRLALATLWVATVVVAVVHWKRAPRRDRLGEPERWKDEQGIRRDWPRRWDE
ncbi:MAG: hypothetical protein OXC19_06435 [Bryobacterales bacterium]|nr:hypothetical protein [Bryobacterales bacterium]